MHLIFILVYTYIYWKQLVLSSTVSTNNCIGFILVSSFSVLIMLFSESEESGSCYWQFNNFPSGSCLLIRLSLLMHMDIPLPLHSFWHSKPVCLCRDDLSSCLTHSCPQCQLAQSRNTFHLAWLCHIAASPTPPTLWTTSQAYSGAPHPRLSHPAHMISLASIFTLWTSILFSITFGTLDLLCCH